MVKVMLLLHLLNIVFWYLMCLGLYSNPLRGDALFVYAPQ